MPPKHGWAFFITIYLSYLSIFLYSGDRIWSFSEVSVLEFWKKSFWLSHLNECPELLCGLSCDHRWSQTIPMRNSPWEKRILQGITISLGPAILWVVWRPGRSCTLRWGQVLAFINRHIPTINLVEEKQSGLIPPGLQSWPLQLIEHFSNTTSVAPPPAGPAGCLASVPSPLVESEFYNKGSKLGLHTPN